MEFPRPSKFCAYQTESADLWLEQYLNYSTALGWDEAQCIRTFPLFLENSALVWYLQLQDYEKRSFSGICYEFRRRFGVTHVDRYLHLDELSKMKQEQGEDAGKFISRVEDKTYHARLNLMSLVDSVIIHGLEPQLKQPMVTHNWEPYTSEDTKYSARVAQAAANLTRQTADEKEIEENPEDFEKELTKKIEEVEKFLVETIKNQKLSKTCNEHKQAILDKIFKLREEYPPLAAPKPIGKEETKSKQDLDRGHSDESAKTTGSSNNDDNEDNYADSSIPLIPASELTDPLVESYLEKKQRKGTLFGGPKLQKRWCVIHRNILYYYENQKDKKQHGAFHLAGYTFEACPDLVDKKDTSKRELTFQLICPAKRTYQFVATTKDDFDKWKAAVEKSAEFVKDDEPEIPDDIYEDCDAPPELPAEPEPIQEDIYDDTANIEELLPDEVYNDCEVAPDLPPPPPSVPKREVPPVPPSPSPSLPSLPPIPPGRHGQPLPAIPPPPPSPRESETKKAKVLPPDQDFENIYVGKWDCSADADNELGFKKGARIHIISRKFDDKDWWVGELNGKFGLVPKPYLVPAYEEARAK